MNPIEKGKKVYGVAEGEVDNFFSRNPYTVLILTGVAVALVTLTVKTLFFC